MQQFEAEIIHYTEDIWKSILDLDVKKSENSFFQLGGESILAGAVSFKKKMTQCKFICKGSSFALSLHEQEATGKKTISV
jgi:hypothetical protein